MPPTKTRTHLTLFVPGSAKDPETWKHALARTGWALSGSVLSANEVAFHPRVEWEANPRGGSFGEAFSFGTCSEDEQREIDAAPGALIVYLPVELAVERVAIARLAAAMRDAGAFAIRVEESKLGFPIERWVALASETDPWTLYRLVVVHLSNESGAQTCGMHVFSLPDAMVGDDEPNPNELLSAFNVYQLVEDPILAAGQTFSPTAGAPRRVLERWPDDGYPAEHPCHNPFGVWRLSEGGRSARPVAKLAAVFVPPLVTLLLAEERMKGRALTKEEVHAIRDNSVCIAMGAWGRTEARESTRVRGHRSRARLGAVAELSGCVR